jgi:hypothetical protein
MCVIANMCLAATNLQLTEPTIYRPRVQELQTLLHGLWCDQLRQGNNCLHGATGPTSLCCTFNAITLKTQTFLIIHIIKITGLALLCAHKVLGLNISLQSIILTDFSWFSSVPITDVSNA